MAKTRTCIASEVFNSDAMESLSADARLLYVYLTFESNIIGEVVKPYRVSRGLGFGDEAMAELVGAGFVLEASGAGGRRYFIAHQFVSNGFSNAGQKASASKALAGASDLVAFAGEEWKSAYRLLGAESGADSLGIADVSPNGRLTAAETSAPEVKESKSEVNMKESKPEREHEAGSAKCPVCDDECVAVVEGGAIHGECLLHGDFFIDAETGEYLEGTL